MMEKLSITRATLPDFIREKKLESKDIPWTLDFDLTARCNNNCRHCFINLPAGDMQARKDELTFEQIEKIADQAVALGTVWCALSGGEPLLRNDFAEVYKMLKGKGLLVSIFTNGTLITDSVIELFKRYPPHNIEITVYGITRETYGRVTGCPANFDLFRNGLDLLLKNRIPVKLKAMVLRSNVHELADIAEFCRKHTKNLFRFDPQLHLRLDGNEQRNEMIRAERLTPKMIADIEHSDVERSEALMRSCDELVRQTANTCSCKRSLFRCGLGRSNFFLSHDGYFRLCQSLTEPSCVYDLKNGTLEEAWHEFRPQILARKASVLKNSKKCQECSIYGLCLWCPAHSYLESKDMEQWVEYFCEVAHARADALQHKMKTSGKDKKQNT